jgi:hypothetical protein
MYRSSTLPGSGLKNKYAERKEANQRKAEDVFSDFFGFDDLPAGATAKGNWDVKVQEEKVKFMSLIDAEAKRYNINNIHTDLNNKMEQVVNNIHTEQKAVMNDEEKQLRNLDKLGYMSQCLTDDHENVKKAINEATHIKNQS